MEATSKTVRALHMLGCVWTQDVERELRHLLDIDGSVIDVAEMIETYVEAMHPHSKYLREEYDDPQPHLWACARGHYLSLSNRLGQVADHWDDDTLWWMLLLTMGLYDEAKPDGADDHLNDYIFLAGAQEYLP